MNIQDRTIRDVDLQKFIKCAEDLASSKEKGKGVFNNKWEWFILRLISELKQPEKQEYKYNFPQMIKNRRLQLNESQSEFGDRFGVSHASVSDWERGISEAGYEVVNFVLNNGIEPEKQEIEKTDGGLFVIDPGRRHVTEYISRVLEDDGIEINKKLNEVIEVVNKLLEK